MNTRLRLGMLTPSSNTVLEPISTQMVAGLPEVSVHFGRFKVTEIALSDQALKQFDDTEILRAAELLAHAKVDVISWNGTSASWLGFDRDERLCERITSSTGIAACTSVLAFREIFERTRVRRIGLVTPYTDDVQAKIIANWKSAGIICSAERHSGLRDNFSFAEVSEHTIAEMIGSVEKAGCEAVAIVCTNMRGAPLAQLLEAKLGIPVYDSIATAVWKSLVLASADPRRVKGWGSLFQDARLSAQP
ncbi:Asp/Glu/hydantoin racemase [Afipia sp. Root123D2]|jgi:maleate isomerase|uniref:maleate cis-trans isomerase family protein n=1 Tax=Nitrobacteraceae TaxID=41294 RepID=UPI0006F944E8|nr:MULTISPECIES: aspartate/glutamate racemase family protein [Nitrobacteraceae]KQW18176.1 Asp/Glu/hydantoin racemase [Afipia sp. Root123D2]MBN9149675.1 aspartate/glutamate racemase family protein [Nitrobacter sp.]OJV00340.1 MAG: Asp/Glu/hydantoin racemase [Nitrobacter sp. 62-23]